MKQCFEKNPHDVTDVTLCRSIDVFICRMEKKKKNRRDECVAREERFFDDFIVIYNNTVVPKSTCGEASSRWVFVIKKYYQIKDHVYMCVHICTRSDSSDGHYCL